MIAWHANSVYNELRRWLNEAGYSISYNKNLCPRRRHLLRERGRTFEWLRGCATSDMYDLVISHCMIPSNDRSYIIAQTTRKSNLAGAYCSKHPKVFLQQKPPPIGEGHVKLYRLAVILNPVCRISMSNGCPPNTVVTVVAPEALNSCTSCDWSNTPTHSYR